MLWYIQLRYKRATTECLHKHVYRGSKVVVCRRHGPDQCLVREERLVGPARLHGRLFVWVALAHRKRPGLALDVGCVGQHDTQVEWQQGVVVVEG